MMTILGEPKSEQNLASDEVQRIMVRGLRIPSLLHIYRSLTCQLS